MELRKLQITGGSTHVVSLPKKWVDRNRLGRSDAVAIHEEPDGSLLLVPHGTGRPKARTIHVQLPAGARGDDVVRRLVGAYLAGADEIQVASEGRMDPKVRQTLRSISRSLVGVEIVEESASGMVLQDLIGITDMDLRKSLTRMQRIARIMFDEAIQALQERNLELAADVTRRDDELDRLLWMVSKQMHALLEQPRLAAKLDVRPAAALNLFLAARSLERMGDHAAKVCANILELEGDVVPSAVVEALVAHAVVVRHLWDDAFASLKRTDFAQASRVADAGEAAAAWRGRFPHVLSDLPPQTVGPVTLIADSIDRVRGYAMDMAETAMNQTFQAA